jgi:hypothetical protein
VHIFGKFSTCSVEGELFVRMNELFEARIGVLKSIFAHRSIYIWRCEFVEMILAQERKKNTDDQIAYRLYNDRNRLNYSLENADTTMALFVAV